MTASFAALVLLSVATVMICISTAWFLDQDEQLVETLRLTAPLPPERLSLLPLEVAVPDLPERVTPTDLWQAYLPHHSAEPAHYECSGPWNPWNFNSAELALFVGDGTVVPA